MFSAWKACLGIQYIFSACSPARGHPQWDWLRIIPSLKIWSWSIISHAPTSHPSWPCKFLFFLYCINDPSRRLTLPPVMTAFSSFWCDFRTLGVSRDWGAFIVIRNRRNAPFLHRPFNNSLFCFFFNHHPFSPEINPVWAIDAVWPFGCNLHFFY